MFKYGKLEKIGSREKLYKLRCECGVVVYRSPQSLSRSIRLGYTPHCGCVEKKIRNMEFTSLKSITKKNNKAFTITEKQFNLIKLRNCYYCGTSDTKVTTLHTGKGYIFENSIATCENCCAAKGVMNHEDFIGWIKKVLSFSKIRDFGLDGVIPFTI